MLKVLRRICVSNESKEKEARKERELQDLQDQIRELQLDKEKQNKSQSSELCVPAANKNRELRNNTEKQVQSKIQHLPKKKKQTAPKVGKDGKLDSITTVAKEFEGKSGKAKGEEKTRLPKKFSKVVKSTNSHLPKLRSKKPTTEVSRVDNKERITTKQDGKQNEERGTQAEKTKDKRASRIKESQDVVLKSKPEEVARKSIKSKVVQSVLKEVKTKPKEEVAKSAPKTEVVQSKPKIITKSKTVKIQSEPEESEVTENSEPEDESVEAASSEEEENLELEPEELEAEEENLEGEDVDESDQEEDSEEGISVNSEQEDNVESDPEDDSESE